MRGSINATELGARPGALDDQSKTFQRMLDKAGTENIPLFLPPGTYVVSNLTLPRSIRLAGVPGATRIVYGGDGYLLAAENAEHIALDGLVLDGANRWIGEQSNGLVDLRGVRQFTVDQCTVLGSGKHGLALERVSGRIERSEITGAADAGVYSIEAGRLAITGNSVTDCANGGILVHRWQIGEDNTVISGNRIERIAARNGGTGQNGNGINAFRANGVMISGNSVADCAFSAIRANSASNLQVNANTCLRSGETAIYAEFAFDGAVINSNIVDGGANGISIVNFNNGGRMGVCNGNIVRNLSAKGPYPADAPGFGTGIAVEADCVVTGNVVENAPLFGISIGWGPYMRNVVATGNLIRKAGTGIAVSVVEGTGLATVTDNIIDTATKGGVVGYRWAEAATGDLALDASEAPANLTVSGNQVS
ncbi:TIGR03808 family TAT-translocated repetitive protein [Mesorhizobium sp. NBSH29]|uniref:TIGR03808 family TAT-translocated repetitive protein n=1 Tax=Mesorhizobium sp. NBSH29 TaxID=2654249 RepID=UPI0021561E53|nr:TIGR03808 family TAT-translocated repetitive protein [Mesorhizobium sp. NBSH29]